MNPPAASPALSDADPQNAPPPARPERPGLLRSASLVAAVTLISKVLGAVRDWVVLTVFGAALGSDAYYAAVQLPSFALILLGGLGGPFHTTTVSFLTRLLTPDGQATESARRLIQTFLTVSALVTTLVAVGAVMAAQPVMGLILHGGSPELVALAARQLQVMAPIFVMGGIIGILYGVANATHRFFWPSLAPAAISLVMMALIPFFPGEPMVLAWGTLLGAGLQLLLQLPDFWRPGFSMKPRLDLAEPELPAMGKMLLPAIVGTSMGQLNVYVDMFFTAMLPVGGWTSIVIGNRLIQLPLGVLQSALLVPIFPRFTQAVADGDLDDLRQTFRLGVMSLWLVGVPMVVSLFLFTETVVRLLFEHGRFDANATRLVTLAVLGLAGATLPFFARDAITRVFYAFQDSRTPLRVGLLAIGVNAMLDALLVGPLGVAGITLSTTLVTWLNMTLLALLSRRHVRNLGFRRMVGPTLRMLLAGAGMALVAGGLWRQVHPLLASRWMEAAGLLACVLVGWSLYAALVLWLKIPEALLLQRRLTGLLRRRLPTA